MMTAKYFCVLCNFEAEADDVMMPTEHGSCICLRCYERETQTDRRVPKALIRDVEDAAKEMKE